MMNTANTNINVKNLCSRKLLELLTDNQAIMASQQINACESELKARRHYLTELQNLQKQQHSKICH